MTPWLTEPTADELSLLRPSAIKLWRVLIRLRDRSGIEEGEWFLGDLRKLSRWASIRSYSTAKAALASLRNAGLVATSRTSQSRWARDRRTGKLTTVQALEQHLYLVPGRPDSRSGMDHMMVPERAWRSFVIAARATAERAKVRIEAWRCELPRAEWRSEWTAEVLADLRGSRNGRKRLGGKSCTSVTKSISSKDRGQTSKKAAAPLPLSFSVEEQAEMIRGSQAEDDDDPHLTSSFNYLGGNGDAGLIPLGPPHKAPYIPPDLHVKPKPTIMWISPEQIPENKARQVLDGYRVAVMKVYGLEWWQYSKGELRKAMHYDKLVKVGEAMAEHSVPPDHWSIWRLRWFKEKNPRFRDRPPPVWVVCSAKTVSERAGWFRKEYDLPLPVLEPDMIIREQNYRNLEASRRWRGIPEWALWYFHFPMWYIEKRKEEIAQGFTSPHSLWPCKSGTRYGFTHDCVAGAA